MIKMMKDLYNRYSYKIEENKKSTRRIPNP